MTRQCVRELERKVILKVLQQHHWNRKQSARTLGISYRALLYKIRDAGLPSNRALRLRQEAKNNAHNTSDRPSTTGAAAHPREALATRTDSRPPLSQTPTGLMHSFST